MSLYQKAPFLVCVWSGSNQFMVDTLAKSQSKLGWNGIITDPNVCLASQKLQYSPVTPCDGVG